MKINENQQNALNEVARQAHLAERANEAKAAALKTVRELIAKNETAFRDGVAVAFDDNGRRVTARLVMNPSPKWQVKDVVVTAA